MSQNQTLRTHAISAGRDYQELPAWSKAVALAEHIYSLREDATGLVAHMRETALTIAASIAAASGRNNEFGMTDSYSKAQSAGAELITQITLAQRLGHLSQEQAEELTSGVDEIARLIVGMKHGLKVAAKDAERAEREAAKAATRDDRGGDERPRREYKPREARGGDERPRREYRPRDGEERPRREYKPREDRGERKPYGDKKPYGDRKPYGDKKPYGERKPYGEKKSYGDKKPYGERKPRGDKPFRKPRDRD